MAGVAPTYRFADIGRIVRLAGIGERKPLARLFGPTANIPCMPSRDADLASRERNVIGAAER
jgi:hypothetical protein